jgi:hypothetical protein
MPITTTIVYEDAALQVVHEDDETGYHGERVVYKSGPVKNQQDTLTQLAAEPQKARDRVTAARASKTAATNAKQLPLTSLTEARTKVNALADVVNDLAQGQLDTNQSLLRVLRYVMGDFSTPPE